MLAQVPCGEAPGGPARRRKEAQVMIFAACHAGYHEWCIYKNLAGQVCECPCPHEKVKDDLPTVLS